MFKEVDIERALLWIEPGPVTLVSAFDGKRNHVMTISWTIALDFAQRIALCTGSWNHTFDVLMKSRECVVAIPPASMAETVIRVGDISGRKVDKFKKFGLTALPASTVKAPLIGGCSANLECSVIDHLENYNLVILQMNKVWESKKMERSKMFHAFGDGRFAANGKQMNYRELMLDKLPPNL